MAKAKGKKAAKNGRGVGGLEPSKPTPVAFHQRYSQRQPRRSGGAHGRHRIENTELVGDLVVLKSDDPEVSESFQISAYRINAGDSVLFPWLARLAEDYEFYRFRSLKLHFVPRVATTTAGQVLMVPDYDPSDPTPVSAAQAMVVPGATVDSAYVCNTLSLDVGALNNFVGPMGHGYYTAPDNDEGIQGSDIRLVDSGIIYVATEGFEFVTTSSTVTTQKIGSLYVEYDVELSMPQSARRQVSEGTSENRVTQPGRFLPDESILVDPISPIDNLPVNVWKRYFDSAKGRPPIANGSGTAFGADPRNFLQYWNETAQAFIADKMRIAANMLYRYATFVTTAPASGNVSVRLLQYRPLDATTVTKPEELIEPEEGWPVAALGVGLDPGGTIVVSLDDVGHDVIASGSFRSQSLALHGFLDCEKGDHFWWEIKWLGVATASSGAISTVQLGGTAAGYYQQSTVAMRQLGI